MYAFFTRMVPEARPAGAFVPGQSSVRLSDKRAAERKTAGNKAVLEAGMFLVYNKSSQMIRS